MRLNAREPGFDHGDWTVWHVEECRNLADQVVWADDETNEYGYVHQRFISDVITVKAKKIVIHYPQRKLIIINPVADDSDEDLWRATELKTRIKVDTTCPASGGEEVL